MFDRLSFVHANLAFLFGLAVLAGGCGGTGSFNTDLVIEKRELGEVYDNYMSYLKANSQPPTEFSHLEEKDALFANGNRALREGKYKVVWGVDDKNARTLLAYAADAAEKGGVVLMADGTVKTMTAAQFKAAKR